MLCPVKQFSVLQGQGWLDVDILKSHGFTVTEGSSYEGLFKMVAEDRAELFMRGANELHEVQMNCIMNGLLINRSKT